MLRVVCLLLAASGPVRAQSLPDASELSAEAVSARSSEDAGALAFRALSAAAGKAQAVKEGSASTAGFSGLKPAAALVRVEKLPRDVPPPPPYAWERPAPRASRMKTAKATVYAAAGACVGLAFGAYVGAALGVVGVFQHTRDIESPAARRSARMRGALPAALIGSEIGAWTYWAAGAKFMWDQGMK